MNIRSLIILFGIFTIISCEKDNPPAPAPLYELYINNEFNELNARFGVFVSDPTSGKTLAFRWAPGEDTLQLQVPGSKPTDRFDCTVIKITTLVAPGTGVRDTFLSLSTYTNLGSGEQFNFRNQVFQAASTLTFNLTGMNTLDSIVVPDAYAISRPFSSNNYNGEYYCYHTGQCWMRVLVNGDPFWKFVRFDNVSGNSLEANTLNVNNFLGLFAPPLKLNFPFYADWQYRVDGVVDTSKLEFFPLSPQLLVPGSLIPTLNSADIFEPVNNDLFEPNRPYEGYRIQAKGTEQVAGGYTLISDGFYSAMPAQLPVPDFDLAPTILADKRLIAVQTIGDFDLLAFARTRSAYGIHLNIYWEVLTRPEKGIVTYRLPDVPTPLATLYTPLKNYEFNAGVRARAESYEKPMSYENIVHQHLSASDVLWQAKAGYLGKEESF